MKRMDTTMDLIGGMEEFVVPETLFESLENLDYDNYNNNTSSMDSGLFSGLELDLSSDTMTSFMEMENIMEVETVNIKEPIITRPSVIKKTKEEEKMTASLSEILTSCGIEYDMVESEHSSAVSSPASSHMDLEMERNQELINDLEDFFLKTDGTPTVVDEDAPVSPPVTVTDVDLSLAELNNAVTTSMVTEDGQNVVIIIAPSSPTDSLTYQDPLNSPVQLESDQDWSPSPASVSSPGSVKPRKKYQRSKPPKCPVGPYPTDKKERKKAQNRTAAFRYREKLKSQQDNVEEELEGLEEKNINLKEKLAEMETEFKYLKKLMMEAGLGQYAAAVSY